MNLRMRLRAREAIAGWLRGGRGGHGHRPAKAWRPLLLRWLSRRRPSAVVPGRHDTVIESSFVWSPHIHLHLDAYRMGDHRTLRMRSSASERATVARNNRALPRRTVLFAARPAFAWPRPSRAMFSSLKPTALLSRGPYPCRVPRASAGVAWSGGIAASFVAAPRSRQVIGGLPKRTYAARPRNPSPISPIA